MQMVELVRIRIRTFKLEIGIRSQNRKKQVINGNLCNTFRSKELSSELQLE